MGRGFCDWSNLPDDPTLMTINDDQTPSWARATSASYSPYRAAVRLKAGDIEHVPNGCLPRRATTSLYPSRGGRSDVHPVRHGALPTIRVGGAACYGHTMERKLHPLESVQWRSGDDMEQ